MILWASLWCVFDSVLLFAHNLNVSQCGKSQYYRDPVNDGRTSGHG